MFAIDKTSNLVTVTADTKLSALKGRLSGEGLYFGYHPMYDGDATIGFHLGKGTPNLYHFKFGSLADLAGSLTFELKSGERFRLTDAPRAAIGPDFNRLIVGSEDKFGKIADVTLKLVPVPERISCAAVFVPSEEAAQALVTSMIGFFVRPLFFRHFDFENVPKSLNAKPSKLVADAVVFCLCGIDDMVRAEEEVLQSYCEENDRILKWLELSESQDFMNRWVFKAENHPEILRQYSEFVWPPSDASVQAMSEKKFLGSL